MNAYKPMMARQAKVPFDNPAWLFEVKWDGIRAIAYVGDELSFRTRNDNELIQKFPELREISELTSNVVLDGEIIVMRDGKPNFGAVIARNQATNRRDIEHLARSETATYIVFDILERDGESLIDLPLMDRLEALGVVLKQGRHVIQSTVVEGDGVQYYEAVIKNGLEGIVAKRKDSLYLPGSRSPDWLKVKHVKTCDCCVFGYTRGEGAREQSFGALLLGLYDEGNPVYVGRVGTGFSDTDLKSLRQRLDGIKRDIAWFDERDIPSGSTWVNPRLVAQVGYHEVTNELRLRAPRFQGLRDDKPPQLCSITQIKSQRLEEYYRKRDFTETPEPSEGGRAGIGNSYVVQEHHATRLHFDLRLERDGVLVSWAVPKGLPLEPNDRRLAIQTEDHPLEYGGFEGTIPKGNYGAGEVSIWDYGFYVPVRWEGDKIEFVLAGHRVRGRYELVRFESAGENEWLLFRKKA